MSANSSVAAESAASGQQAYPEHLSTLDRHLTAALARHKFDALVVPAGQPKDFFQDDQQMSFRANPWFRWWLPVGASADSAGCQLLLRPGERPLLVYQQPEDFWHQPPAPPSGAWTAQVDIRVVPDQASADRMLADSLRPGEHLACLGEEGMLPANTTAALNPTGLLAELTWYRAEKTSHEIGCLAAANSLGARAHLAARDAFFAGGSEFDIHMAYLAACSQRDADLPYNSIVALNEHAAVLHYQHLERTAPEAHRTFLLDAGASSGGYGSDITRTWTTDSGRFAALLAAMDDAQQAICGDIRVGMPYPDLHLSAHRRIGGILQDHGLVAMDPDSQIEQGVTRMFLPHGLGHHLGLQTHDVGGHQADISGAAAPPSAEFPTLRTTRTMAAGQVLTIEPGLYFIPMLLRELRAAPAAKAVDWDLVESLVPFGGIRIEDNVVVTDSGINNLTRAAFAAAGQ